MAGRLTAAEKVKRDQALVARRLKRAPWATLAQEFGIDERSCRRIYYEWAKSNADRGVNALKDLDPLQIVWDAATRYEQWIEQLNEIAYEPEVQDTVRVGAINSQMQAQAKLTALLQETGILPKQLGKLRIEADIRYVAQTIISVLREEDVPDRVQARILAALRGQQSAN